MTPVVLAALADEPFAVAAIAAAWFACGLVVAAFLAGRGHSFRHVGALGFVLGPLLIGFAISTLRSREEHARPVVMRQPRTLDGTERALVVLLGSREHVTDALGVLRTLEDRLLAVDVGVLVTFDDADEEREDGAAPPAAIDALADAADRLGEFGPGLVLLPGRPVDAIARYVRSESADIVVVAGDHDAQSVLCEDQRLRSLATVVGTSYSAT